MKLSNLIPEELIPHSPIDGMKKQQAKNYIYKTFDIQNRFKGFFKDEHWQPINELIGDLQKAGIELEYTENPSYYKDTNGNPAGKIWRGYIPFINQNNRNDKIYFSITAAGAGSVQDPLDKYDCTFVLA